MDVIVQRRWTKPFRLVLTAVIGLGVLALPAGGPVFAAAPVAVDDSATTDAANQVDIVVLANDTDADSDPLTVTEIDGVAITVATPATITSGAIVNLNADGTLTYDPNGAFDVLGDVMDTFDYTVSDGTETDTGTVTVSSSVSAADDAAITDEDTTILIGVLANDSDLATAITAIDGNPFTSGAPIALPSDAIVTVNSGNTLSYDPNGSFDDLGPGESTTDTFDYTVEDDAGGSATATVAITVVGVNHAPTAVDDAVTVDVNGSVSLDVVANDSDIDGDPFTVALADPPEHGTARCVTGGECTYTPDAGYTGEDAFTYSIVDVVTPREFALESTASVNIDVGTVTTTSTTTSTAAGRELPATGNDTGSMTTIALVASLLGLVLVGVSRRRLPL